jgi:hypothetical protein
MSAPLTYLRKLLQVLNHGTDTGKLGEPLMGRSWSQGNDLADPRCIGCLDTRLGVLHHRTPGWFNSQVAGSLQIDDRVHWSCSQRVGNWLRPAVLCQVHSTGHSSCCQG